MTDDKRSSRLQKQLSYKKPEDSSSAEMLYSIMAVFIAFVGWLPLILGLSIPDTRIGLTAGFGAALLGLVLDLVWYKMGRTRRWPKVLNCIFVGLFGFMTILAWALQGEEQVQTMARFLDVVIQLGLALSFVVGMVIRIPFMEDYMIDEVGAEALSYPLTERYCRDLTIIWIVGLTGSGILNLAAAMQPDPTSIIVTVLIALGWVIFALLQLVTWWLYPMWFEKSEENLMERYRKEIDEWVVEHPDHEYATEYKNNSGDKQNNNSGTDDEIA